MDVFALGVMIFMICLGIPPFVQARNSCKFWRMMEQGRWSEYWGLMEKCTKMRIEEELKELLEKMLAGKAEERWGMGEVKAHRWFGQREASQECLREMSEL